jgi:hypothetical protein
MSDLVARVLAQRERWVELDGGLAVRIRRPDALARARMVGMDRSAVIEAAISSAVGWRGFTEAAVLGASQGSDAVVTFDAALWAVLAADRADWMQTVLAAYLDLIEQHAAQQEAAAKN